MCVGPPIMAYVTPSQVPPHHTSSLFRSLFLFLAFISLFASRSKNMSEPDVGDDTDAVETLTQGQGLAFQLRDLFLNDQIPMSGERLVMAEDLLDKIHGSLTDSISALDRRHSAGEMKSDEVESGESSRSRRSSFPKPAASRRKRRELVSEGETWEEITSALVHDGHAWRKYGQKPILHSNYSRSYYKCTNKDQFGCRAKKHVQQIGDDPLTYKTVYTFRHTCTTISNNSLEAPASQMIHESALAPQPNMNMTSSSSVMLNFQSNQHHSTDHGHYNYNNNAVMKQEYTTGNDQIENHLTSVQQITSGDNNLGSSSECMALDGFMNCPNDHYPPYTSYYQDTDDDPWFK